MPCVVPCFASLLVSRICPKLSPYLGSVQGSRTLFTRVHLLFTPMSQQLFPRLDPTPNAHLSMCAGPWPETRHDRRFATHLFSFQRRAPTNLATIVIFEVALIHADELPSSRWETRFNPLTKPKKDFLFPSQIQSTDLLTPSHCFFDPERPPKQSGLLPKNTLVKTVFLPQTRMPSIDSHPKIRLFGTQEHLPVTTCITTSKPTAWVVGFHTCYHTSPADFCSTTRPASTPASFRTSSLRMNDKAK